MFDRPVAIVTGGSGGLAPGLVEGLTETGHVVVVTARDASRLAAAARMSQAFGREVVALPGDVTDPDQARAVTDQALSLFHRIDVLVNAAASSTPIGGAIEAVDIAALMADMDTKVGGYLRMIQAVTPAMKAQGHGRIINIGGLTGRSSDTLSGLRNAAVAHLNKVMADQLGPFGITVNAIHPGILRSPHLRELFADIAAEQGKDVSAVEQDFLDRIPTRRLLEPIEIGRAAAFLAGPSAGSINGESITIDGGYSRGVYL